MSEQDKRTCNILCIVSIILVGLPILSDILSFVFSYAFYAGTDLFEEVPYLTNILYGTTGLMWVSGIVLMIIARVKYPQSLFAKVLMWVYIALFIISVVLMIIAIIALAVLCSACIEMCRGMGFISLINLF